MSFKVTTPGIVLHVTSPLEEEEEEETPPPPLLPSPPTSTLLSGLDKPSLKISDTLKMEGEET